MAYQHGTRPCISNAELSWSAVHGPDFDTSEVITLAPPFSVT